MRKADLWPWPGEVASWTRNGLSQVVCGREPNWIGPRAAAEAGCVPPRRIQPPLLTVKVGARPNKSVKLRVDLNARHRTEFLFDPGIDCLGGGDVIGPA